MGTRCQIPENWDRYEAIKFMEGFIKKKVGAFRVRVTAIEETNDFGKRCIYTHYNKTMTTSRRETPGPDLTFLCDFSILENHMKIFMRDEKINDILDDPEI